MKTLVRVHVMLPREVVDEIDSALENESRSQYVLKAIESQLSHDRQREALEALRAAEPPTDTPPEWATPEGSALWVHNLRRNRSFNTEFQENE